jgi:hypothetical protein
MRTDIPEGRPARTGDPVPGWSDAELERASTSRALEPDSESGIADPGAIEEDFAISPAEIEEFGGIDIVGNDGRVVPLSAYMDEIARDEDAIALINACRA